MNFDGILGPSKSVMNRALLVRSFTQPPLTLTPSVESPTAMAEDIRLMSAALEGLRRGEREFDCGHAGTVLRFLAARVAREKGSFLLRGRKRLFQRPQAELVKVLSQLGSYCEIREDEATGDGLLKIQSDGWRLCGDAIWIAGEQSSQFTSAILLSAWDLPFDLPFSVSGYNRGEAVSLGYFQMTLQMVRSFGMQVRESASAPGEYSVPRGQKILAGQKRSYAVECDVSSAFAVAALAAVGGECRIRNFPSQPLQPDGVFVRYLIEMGVPLRQSADEGLHIQRAQKILPLQADLKNSPDLFPVLAALCAVAEGESRFTGIEHLRHKESDRIEKTVELLRLVGADLRLEGDTVAILPRAILAGSAVNFDPDQDHRMAMAASVLIQAGANITICSPEVVNKSFPRFWTFAPSRPPC